MNLRQLEYFMAIAEEHQITAAARRLHITQPPLSYELSSLERELGVKLIERGPRSAELTEAGQLLYARAERILSLTSAATREVKSFGQGTSGTLSVGIISSSGGLMPTPSMQRLCRNYPQLRLELHEGDTYEVLDMLKRGEVDVGVVRTPFPLDGLNVTYASTERMLALIPKGIRCGKSPDTITLEELSGQPLVIYKRFEHLLEDLLNERQLTFFPACVADDARTACVWSTRGMGIGLVPESFLATMKHGGTTNKIVDCPELVTQMAAVWRKGSYLPPLAERFIKMFENDCAEEAKAKEAQKAQEEAEDSEDASE